MQKLNTFGPGHRFQWEGKKYQVLISPNRKKKGIIFCVTTPEYDRYLNFNSETMVKPVIRINSN